jgi:hypothetical protein
VARHSQGDRSLIEEEPPPPEGAGGGGSEEGARPRDVANGRRIEQSRTQTSARAHVIGLHFGSGSAL